MLPRTIISETEDYRWHQSRVTLAAGEEQPVYAPFKPRWWVVYPAQAITGEIEVFLGPQHKMFGMPLTGYSPLTLPGMSDYLIIKNKTYQTHTLNIIAGLGYDAPIITLPLTLARPTSALVQSQTRDEGSLYAGVHPSMMHMHIGRFALVFAALMEAALAPAQYAITSLTLGGASGVPVIVFGQLLAGARFVRINAYWVDTEANGPQLIQLTLSPPPIAGVNGQYYIQALSFTDGLRSGNSSALGRTTVGTLPLAILGDHSGSRTWFACMAWTASLPITEITAAPVWDAEHGIAGGPDRRVMMNVREGAGTQNATYSIPAGTQLCAVAEGVEVTTT